MGPVNRSPTRGYIPFGDNYRSHVGDFIDVTKEARGAKKGGQRVQHGKWSELRDPWQAMVVRNFPYKQDETMISPSPLERGRGSDSLFSKEVIDSRRSHSFA